MNSSWQEFLGASGARVDNGLIADFGDLAAELVCARDATIISPLVHLGLIEFVGDDAKSFLHNQLTSDINHLAAGSAQHSAWCSAKGRMLASFLLYRQGPGYRALLSTDLQEAVQKRLQMYVLRSKVKIANISTGHEVIGLSGAQAEMALQGAGLPIPRAMETSEFSEGTVIRLDDTRFAIVVAGEAAAEFWKNLATNARPAGTSVWQWLDIQAGIPRIAEATKEAFVPQMADFDKIGGVSFHKGCYPGQEIVARAQYLGKIKRHLYRIHTATVVTAGTAIYPPSASPEHPCGMVANAAPSPGGGCDALAVVQEGFVETESLRVDVPGTPGMDISAITLVNA